MRKLMVVLFALLLFFIGAGLRIWNLTESPGYEEISASLAAMRSPGDYLRNEQIALCPPVFYFMIRLLALIGGQLGSMGHLGLMRIPSVFFGALTPVILYIAARRLFNERAAILGSFFLAVNPLHIFFSQEVQPAALFIAVSVIAFYYFVRSGETNKARHWAFFDVASILLLHIHSEGLFVLGSFLLLHLLKVLFFRNPEEQRRVRKLRLLATVLFNYLINR
jgi:4-amino-4-deoxy-L-arabinose transferase-like glycosyltransferase